MTKVRTSAAAGNPLSSPSSRCVDLFQPDSSPAVLLGTSKLPLWGLA